MNSVIRIFGNENIVLDQRNEKSRWSGKFQLKQIRTKNSMVLVRRHRDIISLVFL